MHLLRYAGLRLLSAIPTILLVGIAVFLIVRLVPGDPARILLGDAATEEALADLRGQMGLDRSIVEQFIIWGGNVLRGDLGNSIANGHPVLPLVLDRFAVSSSIVLVAVGLAALVAVPAGMLAAWRQGSARDLAVVALSSLLLSLPSFWLGLILLLVFGLELGWLPVVGYVPLADDARGWLIGLILPIATLALVEVGVIARMARSATIEVRRLEYIAHARAKGLRESTVLWVHAFPNAFAPTWTLLGLILGNLLGGIAVVETVFTIPGLGRLLVDAIYARDYPVVQGCLLFIALVYVVVNALVDLAYPLLDPRVTAE
ncbi:ABC transporter permease [Muricoccus radiodurans]|uniref:ABC transporter permease n=1 Tax=Muricoccus radiodurans TaxID=2231721 RepID=UPI003CE72C9F